MINRLSTYLKVLLASMLLFFSTTAITQVEIEAISTTFDLPTLSEESISQVNPFIISINSNGFSNILRVSLGVTIEGSGIYMASKTDLDAPLFALNNSGVTVLSTQQLAKYLDIESFEISGYTNSEYQQNGLPEGAYNICFEVIDRTSDSYNVISRKECLSMWVRRQNPPKFSFPLDGGLVNKANPSMFSWIPQHISSFPVKYQLTIFEQSNGLTPEELYLYHEPIAEVTAFAESITSTPLVKKLKENNFYIAYVQVIPLYNDLKFVNRGLSLPIMFQVIDDSKKAKEDLFKSVQPCDIPASDVIINEISQGENFEEYIELLVVGSEGSDAKVNLEGYIIDDNNHASFNVGNESGHIRLGSCLSSISKGTLVVLYDDDNIENVPGNSSDVIFIPFSSPCIIKYGTCPNALTGNDSYDCPPQAIKSWQDGIPMMNLVDVTQLRSGTGELVHAIRWGDASYSFANSSKTVNMSENASANSFAFTSGTDWNDASNWSVEGPHGTMGEPNNTGDNLTLINAIKSGDYQNNFSIECSKESNDIGSSEVQSHTIAVTVTTDVNTGYEVYLTLNDEDEVLLGIYTTNTFDITVTQSGTYTIRVVNLLTGCEDICITEFEIDCSKGDPCNDFNACTVNDQIINDDCECVGVDVSQVTIAAESNFEEICSYYVTAHPDPSYIGWPSWGIHSILIQLSNGNIITLNSSNNTQSYDEDGLPIQDDESGNNFNFPYSDYGVESFINDFNDWMLVNGYLGLLSGNTTGSNNQASDQSVGFEFLLEATNLTLLEIGIHNGFGNPQIITINEVDCNDSGNQNGFILSLLSECVITHVEWSNGEVTNEIIVPTLEACYEVTVTTSCEDPDGGINPASDEIPSIECILTAQFGEGCDCEPTEELECCVVGEPCTPDPEECYVSAIWNDMCECETIPGTDLDNDGVCDPDDICPGFDDDGPDEDGDGVPDACDKCPGHDDAEYLAALLTETTDDDIDCNPPYDPDDPCDDFVAELLVEQTTFGGCDYCQDLEFLLTGDYSDSDLSEFYLNNFQFTYEGQTYIIDPTELTDEQGNLLGVEYQLSDNSALAEFILNQLESIVQCNSLEVEVGILSQCSSGTESISIQNACFSELSFSFYYDDGNIHPVDYCADLSDLPLGQNLEPFLSEFFLKAIQFNYEGSLISIEGPTDINLSEFDDLEAYIIDQFDQEVDCPDLQVLIDDFTTLCGSLPSIGFSSTCFNNITSSFYHEDSPSNILTVDEVETAESYDTFVSTPISENCGNIAPGTTFSTLTVDVTCHTTSIVLWSTGESTESIDVVGEANYTVTVTCGECEPIELDTDLGGDCEFGEECTIVCLDNTTQIGTMNVNCECEYNDWSDEDGDGIHDCEDECLFDDCIDNCECATEPELCLTPKEGFKYGTEIKIDRNEAHEVKELVLKFGGQSYYLSSYNEFFNFPYIAEKVINDPLALDLFNQGNGINHLFGDIYAWALEEGLNLAFEPNYTNDFIIFKILGFDEIVSSIIKVDPLGNINGASLTTPYIEGYNVDVIFNSDCDVCNLNSPTFVWSNDPNPPSNESSNFISDLSQGLTVLVICSDECSYFLDESCDVEWDPQCILGTPCDDADPCTDNDIYLENCFCQGTPESTLDDDKDGVYNHCDICPGFDDNIDTDYDGYPNGCDQCEGGWDPFFYDDNPDNNPTDCIECTFESIEAYNSYIRFKPSNHCNKNFYIHYISVYLPNGSTLILDQSNPDFNFPYCINVSAFATCSQNSTPIASLEFDINTWLDSNGYLGSAEVSNFGELWSIGLSNSLVYFKILFFDCNSGVPTSAENLFGATNNSHFRFFVDQTTSETGGPCDDGNPCTINDVWDENCQCAGTYSDSDGDTVCDAEDLCPDWPDYIGCSDLVPCIDPNDPDNIVELDVCEVFESLYGVSQQSDNHDGQPIVIQHSALSMQCNLRNFFLQAEIPWDPAFFNIPQLAIDLQNDNDADGDDIVDILDLFPNNDNFPNGDGYYDFPDDIKCDLLMANPNAAKTIALLKAFQFSVANQVYDPNSTLECANSPDGTSTCPEDVQIAGYVPGCAYATGGLGIEVYEDENCVLRNENGCAIEFGVDCYGNCYYVFGDPADSMDGNCFDEPVVLNDCGDPGDPPSVSPCTSYTFVDCEWQEHTADCDGDGICDSDDPCPCENIGGNNDSDGDGIQDCIDDCDGQAGTIGDPCDDGNLCTFNDVVTDDCNCVGHLVDQDGDGVYDCDTCENNIDNEGNEIYPCEPCIAAIDDDGDGYPDQIDHGEVAFNHDTNDDGSFDAYMDPDGNITSTPILTCDVCPGLDDLLDENNDGKPDCLFPPHYDIGCPSSITPIQGEGLVLTFPNDGVITMEDLPEPVSFTYVANAGAPVEIGYLTIDYISESASGFEVFYADPEMVNATGYMAVTYGASQPCAASIPPGLSDLTCPSGLSLAADGSLILDFSVDEDYTFDLDNIEGGNIILDIYDITGVGDDINTTVTVPNPGSDENEISLEFGGLGTISEITNYTGSITLPNGTVCPIDSGQTQSDCQDENGDPIVIGSPCDDGDMSTHHDKYIIVDEDCICLGEPNPEYIELNCPSAFTINGSVLEIVFDAPVGYEYDIASITGDVILGSDTIAIDGNIVETDVGVNMLVIVSDPSIYNPFEGEFTLPNGIACSYDNGEPETPCTITGPDGIDYEYSYGDPCDDGDPCTHHDLVNENCECEGDDAIDSDGDGLCDEFDECENTDADNDGNLDADDVSCPCPDLVPEGESMVNGGGDFEILLGMDEADGYDNMEVTVTGGPEDMDMTDMDFNSPVTVPNLPSGYIYTITITADCPNGGSSTYTTQVEVPFSDDDIFCGMSWAPIDLTSVDLLPSLNYGDVFLASDFDITVKEATGSYGTFTGKGYIKVPYLNFIRINVKWNDIIVSADNQMIAGFVEVDGYGFAILGDQLSDAINGAINDVINVLEDVNDILNEVISILEDIEELVETTSELVSEESNTCVQNATTTLETYNNTLATLNADPNSTQAELDQATADVQAATQVLQTCIDQYNAELAGILNDLLGLFNTSFDNLLNGCEQNANVHSDYVQSITDLNLLIPSAEDYIDELPTNFGGGQGFANLGLSDDGVEVEHPASPNDIIDQPLADGITDYFTNQKQSSLCVFLEKVAETIEASNDEFSASEMTELLQMFLQISEDYADQMSIAMNQNLPEAELEALSNTTMENSIINYIMFKYYGE